MLSGTKPSAAAEFSFLMAIPAIAAVAVLELGDIGKIDPAMPVPYSVGVLVAFLSGL